MYKLILKKNRYLIKLKMIKKKKKMKKTTI